MRLTPFVGALAPGRFADVVLLDDVSSVSIAKVWADGELVAASGRYLKPVPHIDWPRWATHTINIRREMRAEDFAITAEPGATTMRAALLRPFHWEDGFLEADLPVADGLVQRDASQAVTKFAIVDRFSGEGRTSAMFWRGTGPKTPGTALAASLGHDKHNIWTVGSCDAAMALAVNTLREQQGGWALVRDGEVLARVRYEIGGLMSARDPRALDAEMQDLYRAAETIEWMWEPTSSPRWGPGFPERLAFATLTCAPWRWVLVAPSERAPNGFVNVATGQTHPVVWSVDAPLPSS